MKEILLAGVILLAASPASPEQHAKCSWEYTPISVLQDGNTSTIVYYNQGHSPVDGITVMAKATKRIVIEPGQNAAVYELGCL